jgi:hypothetical protein
MRKLIAFTIAALLAVFMLMAASPAQAGDASRKRKQKSQPETVTMESLAELVRRAEQAAAAAQVEARRAREQTEAMQQQLAQTVRELAALRQSMQIADRGQVPRVIADLKKEPSDQKNVIEQAATLVAGQQASNLQSDNPQPSSNPQLADRVATLEEQVEINSAQIKEHAQTKVESDSRLRVRLSGMILVNTFLNSADSSVRSTPTRAPALADQLGATRHNVGANLRQTLLGLTMEGPKLAGARLSAETEFDFYGTFGDSFRGNALGALRLRTASTRLDWERTSLTIGLRPVMISPRNPSSLAMVWYSAMAEAGNLWQWRPQIILEHRPQLSDSSELVLQGGLLTPFGETLDSLTIEGALNYQGRVAFRHNFDTDRKLEIGVAGQAGQRSFILNRKETTYVISSDWLIPFSGRLELSGEAYFSKANNLGEQSGTRADSYYALSGPIDNPATTIRGIHAFGGWAQLAVKARRDLDFNFAFGIEDPRNRDVFSDRHNTSPYFKNEVLSGNFIYQLRQNLLLSVEYRRLWTDYSAGRRRNNHYNLTIGYLF